MKFVNNIALALALLPAAANCMAVPLDLTKDLEFAPNSNDSPGAEAINEVAASDPLIRTMHLLENGKIVSSYVRDDVDPEVPWMSWSVTKSYVGLILGLMLQDGSLESLDLTLGDLFPDESLWAGASDVDFRKNVSILELLTMTSGLISPPVDPNVDPNVSMMASFDGGTDGGASLADSLAFPAIGPKGEFSYLGTSNIMSYVIKNKTGMSPREYLAKNVLPSLGMDDSEIGWWKNADGMEYAYHGIELTPAQMAKFGLLYMQMGVTGPDNKSLVPAEWIEASTSVQVQDLPVPFDMSTYGYFFWGVAGNTIWSSLGAGGQDIYIDSNNDKIGIVQRDFNPLNPLEGNLMHVGALMNPNLSFEKEGGEEPVPEKDGGEKPVPETVPETETELSSASALATGFALAGAVVAPLLL